jgi:ribosome modulation factor
MEINGDQDVLNARPEDVKRMHADLARLDAKKHSVMDETAAVLKPCDEQKIHKQAFKLAHKLAGMDAGTRDDFLHALDLYSSPDYLNLRAQGNLFTAAGQTAANVTTGTDAGDDTDRLRTAKAQGYQAGVDGLDITLCPYSARSQEAEKMAWANEWRRAQDDRLQETFGAGAKSEDGDGEPKPEDDGQETPPDGDADGDGSDGPKDGEPQTGDEAEVEAAAAKAPPVRKRDRTPRTRASIPAVETDSRSEGSAVH